MKRIPLLLTLALCAAATLQAEDHFSFKGTVIKMETTNCPIRGFRDAMSGTPISMARCPEYTVMSPNVVYVVIGRNNAAFIPLAQDLDFRVIENELLVVKSWKSRFVIRSMMLRSDWEREQQRRELMMERSVNYGGTLTVSAR